MGMLQTRSGDPEEETNTYINLESNFREAFFDPGNKESNEI